MRAHRPLVPAEVITALENGWQDAQMEVPKGTMTG